MISDHSVGVFPADKIVERWHKPCAFVFNLDNSTQPGSHWVSIYVTKNSDGFYFDSYGLLPTVPNHIRVLRKNCRQLRYNTVQLQSESSKVCGQFCIMFLFFMCRGGTLFEFQNIFSSNLKNNDRIAYTFVDKIIKKNKIKHDKRFLSGLGVGRSRFVQNCLCKK